MLVCGKKKIEEDFCNIVIKKTIWPTNDIFNNPNTNHTGTKNKIIKNISLKIFGNNKTVWKEN